MNNIHNITLSKLINHSLMRPDIHANMPPSLGYTVKMANSAEKALIIKRMVKESRQTMNLRLMPTAKLFLLQDNEHDNAIVGWAGVDCESNPSFPEMFSQFIMSAHRQHNLGLFLTHVRCALLNSHGINKAYIRMEASSNQKLITRNINSGFYRLLEKENINSAWQAKCFECELYQHACKSQSYLEVDVNKLLAHCIAKNGLLGNLNLTQTISLTRNTNGYYAKWI